jgi:hypothetical protein
MDELLLVAVPVALVTALAAVVKPARERVVPVAKAVGRAGVGVAEVTAAGARGVVDAAVHGESASSGGRSRRAGATPETRSSGRTQRRPAKAPGTRTRRRSPTSATS